MFKKILFAGLAMVALLPFAGKLTAAPLIETREVASVNWNINVGPSYGWGCCPYYGGGYGGYWGGGFYSPHYFNYYPYHYRPYAFYGYYW